LEGVFFTEDFKRKVKEGSGDGASFSAEGERLMVVPGTALNY
jgi:hypothetical protein